MCNTVTYRQFTCIFTLSFLALNFLTYPSRLSAVCATDGLMPIIFSSTIAYCGQCALFKVMSHYSGMSFPDVLKKIFGKAFGTFVNMVFIINFMLFSIYSVRLLGEQICTHLLKDVPLISIELIFYMLVVYLLLKRIRTQGNISQILIRLVLFNFVVLFIFTVGSCRFENMFPLFTSGFEKYLEGTMVTSAYLFSATLALPYFLPFVSDFQKHEKHVYRDFLYITLIVCLVYCAFYVLCVSVLGVDVCSSYVFPAMSIVQSDNSQNSFLERYEVILLLNVFIMLYLYVSTMLRSINIAIGGQVKEAKKTKLIFYILLTVMLALLIFLNSEGVGRIVFRFFDTVNFTANHALLPFVVFAGFLFRKDKVKNG